MITIVDYGLGNLGSIRNMLKRIGAESRISGDPGEIRTSGALILPGVGAFDHGMANLREKGLEEPLNEAARIRRRPVLGICLGMQLLTRMSEEGELPGLGWIEADTRRFRFPVEPGGPVLRVPHMGWNIVTPKPDSVLFRGMTEQENRFYFVHSYRVLCDNPLDVGGMTPYGEPFCSVIESGNILATQFHPEKSHRFGMRLLENFAALTRA